MITLILGISVDGIIKEEGMNSQVLGKTIFYVFFLMFCSLLTLVQVLTWHLT